MGILDKLFPKKASDPEGRCAVVVVAAGSATRMEGIDKITTPLGGEPLVLHALAPFQESSLVAEIIIVTREDKMVEIGALCSGRGFDKVKRIVKGGDTRTESVWAGIKEISQGTDFIAIHDGARPFVTREIVEETIRTAKARSAAAPAIPLGPPRRAFSPAIPTPPPNQRAPTAGDCQPEVSRLRIPTDH